MAINTIKPLKPFRCKYADCKSEGFQAISKKEIHERDKHGDFPKCHYCGFSAKRKYQIQNHIELEHNPTQSTLKELSELLEAWDRVCPLCYWRDGPEQNHQIEVCRRPEAEDIKWVIQEMIKYETFSSCHYCGAPQAIFQKRKQKEERSWWHKDFEGYCQCARVLAGAIATMLAEGENGVDEIAYKLMREDMVDVSSDKEVYGWLGEELDWSGIKTTRMVRVFYMLAKLHWFIREYALEPPRCEVSLCDIPPTSCATTVLQHQGGVKAKLQFWPRILSERICTAFFESTMDFNLL